MIIQSSSEWPAVRHWRDEFVCNRKREKKKKLKFNFLTPVQVNEARVRRETDIIASSRGWSPHEIPV